MATQVREQPARPTGKHDAFITAQLARVASRIRLIDLATAALGFVGGTLAFTVVMVLLDRQFVLSAGTRQVALVAYLGAAAAYLFYSVVRPLTWRVNPRYAARQLEQTLPATRNHVLNWIDLHGEQVPGVIRSALGQKAAKDLTNADVDGAISGRRAITAGSLAAVFFVLFITLFLLFGPAPFASLLARAFAPFGQQTGIATRTQVRILRPEGGDATVTIGNPVTIVAEVTGRVPDARDKDAPCLLYRHEDSEPWRQRFLQADETSREWATTVSPLDIGTGFTYRVSAGDATTPEYRVKSRAAPLIAEFLATYRYRPYVGRAERTRTQRQLEDLRGTEVTLLIRTNRVVKDGRLDFDATEGGGDLIRADKVAGDPQALRFRMVLDRTGRYRLRFTSTEGETYLDPQAHDVIVLPDLPPQVRLTRPGKDVTLPANGHLELEGEASDDIGIARVALHLQVAGGSGRKKLRPRPYLADKLGKPGFGTPRQLDYRELLVLRELVDEKGEAVALEPGTVIEYWLEVSDACDYLAPNTASSQPKYKITIEGPTPDAAQKKEQQAARDRKKEHDKQQEEQLQKENADREAQRQRDEAQQRDEQRRREEQRKQDNGADGKDNKGETGEQKDKKDDGKKGSQGGKDGKGGEGSAEQQKRDDETKRQAEELKKAMDRREQEKDGNPGEARGEGQDRPGKTKEGGEKSKKPDGDRPGEGREGTKDSKDKAGENKDGPGKPGESGSARPEGASGGADKSEGKEGGKPKADTPPGKSKGNADKPRPAEKKDAGTGDKAREAGNDRSGERPPPGGAGEGRDAKQAGDPKGSAGEKKDGAGTGDGKGTDKPGSSGKSGEKGGTGKPAPNAPRQEKPGTDRGGDPPGDGTGKPGEPKGDGKKTAPEKATVKDVQDRQQDLKRGDAQARQKAAQDLDAIQKKAGDADAREAARKALEQAKKDFEAGKLDQTPPQQPADAPAQAKPEEATKQDVDNLQKTLGKGSPQEKAWAREQMEKIKTHARNPDARQAAQKELERAWDRWLKEREPEPPAKAEKPLPSRPSTLQLEDFRKKVDRDVLKDAKMSPEQFEKFLKDYAELVKRQPNRAGEPDEVLPPPSSAGTLPATVGRPGTPPGAGKPEDLRNEGRAMPPPGYREAYQKFLKELETPKR